MLTGHLGTAVIKTSAVEPEHRVVTAPAVVFDDQADFLAAFRAGSLDARLRRGDPLPGAAANGMPELHKLTPALGVLQDRGQRVAIVTDGRMSGASGKVPGRHPRHARGRARRPAGPGARRRPDHRRRRHRGADLDVRRRRVRRAAPRPAGRRRPTSGSAPAASCSPASAPPSAPPTRAPASSGARLMREPTITARPRPGHPGRGRARRAPTRCRSPGRWSPAACPSSS